MKVTLNKSATSPWSETWKIGASGSLLIATITLESFIPAKCWMAPDIPTAMYNSYVWAIVRRDVIMRLYRRDDFPRLTNLHVIRNKSGVNSGARSTWKWKHKTGSRPTERPHRLPRPWGQPACTACRSSPRFSFRGLQKQLRFKKNSFQKKDGKIEYYLPPEMTILALLSSGRSLFDSSWLTNWELEFFSLGAGASKGEKWFDNLSRIDDVTIFRGGGSARRGAGFKRSSAHGDELHGVVRFHSLDRIS